MMPSPQAGSVQLFVHSSLSMRSPSSHVSTPFSRTPSPQAFKEQSFLHASASSVLPSSHCSPGSITRSPQSAGWQVRRQAPGAALELFAPSSHVSLLTGSMMSSPHQGFLQFSRHASAVSSELFIPLSHCSFTSRIPLPQDSGWHVALQPSPESVFSSSQPSLALHTNPSPHSAAKHVVGRHAPFSWLSVPSSHSSPRPGSVVKSPHDGFWQSVRQGSPVTFELPSPKSHCSPCPGSVTLSPQDGFRQSSRHVSGVVSEFTPSPRSHCSAVPLLSVPSPQYSITH